MLNLDTHILIDALRGELSKREKTLLLAHPWSISAIVLWEFSKLAQLKKLEIDFADPELSQVLCAIHTWPLTYSICCQIHHLDFKSDPADEIISATSIVHKVPLLTRDKKILSSKLVPFI